MAKRAKRAPDHLTPESKSLWRQLCGAYDFEIHDLERLRCGLEARDRMDAARKTLDAEGTTYLDRFGAPRARPELSVERDSRLAYIRCLRELGLDLADAEAARPPALYK